MRAAIVILILLVLTAAYAQETVSLPDTPPAKLLGEWIKLMNAGDRAELEVFLKAHYAQSVLRGRDPGELASEQLQRLAGHDGVELASVEKSSASEIVAILKSRGTLPKFVRISWRLDDANPQLIAASAISPAQAPASARLPLDKLGAELESKLEELTRRDAFSGVALIAKDGKAVWQKAFGFQDREKKIPANLETRFRLGSMNKMFTSVAIAQLVEAGKMKFTDKLAAVLPDYPNKEVAGKITVEQLLTHTSGLGDFFNSKFEQKKDTLRETKDYLPLFADDPLQFEPGKSWSYSNAGFIVLGRIIEKVSGENYYDYIQHHIYDVAGMKSSADFPKTERPENLATGYMRDGGTLRPNWDTLPWRGGPAGGGDSTVGDLLRFANALRSSQLVSATMTQTITTGKVQPQPGAPDKYAYGFFDRNVNGRRVVGHGGGAPGMNAELSILWDNGYTVIVLANLDPPAVQDVAAYIIDRLP